MTKPLIAVPLQVENPDTSLYSIKKRYLARSEEHTSELQSPWN